MLVLVFLLEATVGGLAYIYESQIEDELQLTLKETFITNYGLDERKTNAIDLMQQRVSPNFSRYPHYTHKKVLNLYHFSICVAVP